jgi:hypothetical protein
MCIVKTQGQCGSYTVLRLSFTFEYTLCQRDRIDAPENEKFPANEPIQLQSGTYRIICR